MCNNTYFNWFGSIKINFPFEMWAPIKMLIFGSISDIKNIIVEKTTNAYSNAREFINRRVSNNQQENEEPRYQNNPDVNIIDR